MFVRPFSSRSAAFADPVAIVNQAKAQAAPVDIGDLNRTYAVVREIGRGGMGAIVLAQHRRTWNHVAIKIASTEKFDAEGLARFEREARLMALLQHPNIVRLYEVRKIGGGRVGIVMEYVHGVSLAHLLTEQKALPFERCTSILRDLGQALAHAHARGVVHRDVKPHNVLLDAASGVAKLSDFGIAKGTGEASEVTIVGAVVGTPAYMSPEQIDGKQIDGRSDIYALGILGWQIVTGEQPWAGEALFQLLFKQKNEALRSVTLLRPDAPANLVLALEGALEKDPALRWGSVDDMVAQLESTEPTPAMLERRTRVASAAALRPRAHPNDQSTVQFQRPLPQPLAAAPVGDPEANNVVPPNAGDAVLPASATELSAPGEVRSRPRWLRPAEFAVGAFAGALCMLLALRQIVPGDARDDVPALPARTTSAAPNVSSTIRARPAPATTAVSPGARAQPTATPTPAPLSDTGTMRDVAAPRESVRARATRALDLVRTVAERASGAGAAPHRTGASRSRAVAVPERWASDSARFAAATLARRAESFALSTRARSLLFAGNAEQAKPIIDSALALDNGSGAAHVLRARLLIARGKFRDAWTDIELGARLGAPWEALSLMTMLNVWRSDPVDARRRIAPQLRAALTPRRVLDAQHAVSMAGALVQLGDTSTALTLLELAAHDSRLPLMLEDPLLAPLRFSGRFDQVRRNASR